MRIFYRTIATAAVVAMLTGAASADGYEPAPLAAQPALQISNWTGFYANAGVGYGLWQAETTVDLPGGGCILCGKSDAGGRGWLGEVGLGYDFQLNDKFVIGALFNYNISDMSGNLNDGFGTVGESKNDSTWFLGGRIGWLMTPNVLNYWSAGYTQANFASSGLNVAFGAPIAGLSRDDYSAGGWFIGGGLEVAMSNGWFWRSEVRVAEYSKEAIAERLNGTAFANLQFDPVVETATSEIVYKLNWPH
jgi:outer membrane immunogenic protein